MIALLLAAALVPQVQSYAGTNAAWMATATDLRGKTRVVGPAVDIGCYENQQQGMLLLVR